MSIIKDKLGSRISWIVFICLAIQMAKTVSGFTDVPPPPTRPTQFRSREELKRYLQLVHEYYAIIGRPRFGRSFVKTKIQPNDGNLLNFFNNDGQQSIRYNEFHDRLEK